LAAQREDQQRSQTAIAAAMATSQSSVARLESTAADAKISTLERFAQSLGFTVQYHLIPTTDTDSTSPVVIHA
jgi:predicted transcriptional regulator